MYILSISSYFNSVTILDVNDNKPELIVDSACVNITEFHEPGQPITIVRATDKDDPTTSNGQVTTPLLAQSIPKKKKRFNVYRL